MSSKNYLNVVIKGLGTYLPANKIGNEPYVEHFRKMGIEIEHILESIGREYRYISNDLDETVITMGIKASERALKNANIKPEDIDILIFASDTPEYTTPTNALKIHHGLGAKNAKVVYDVNSNCMGAIVAIDQVSRLMKTNKRYKKALVVGSVLISSVARKDDLLTYATFGDSASAIVLEAVEEDVERGVLDSVYYTDSSQHDSSHNPTIGFSRFFRTDIADNNKELVKWQSNPVESNTYPGIWANMVKDILGNNNLSIKDADFFIFSQFVEALITGMMEILEVENIPEKYSFITKEFGYTGVNCELFALQDSINKGKLHEGSNLLLSGAGVGFTTMIIYYKF